MKYTGCRVCSYELCQHKTTEKKEFYKPRAKSCDNLILF